MYMRLTLLLFCTALFCFSCTKTELETIPDNIAPPDRTIEIVTIENYVTRTFILTLGREPNATEFSSSVGFLRNASLDSVSRAQFLTGVFADAAYKPQVYLQNKINLLNNADTADFTEWITIFNFLLQDSTNLYLFSVLHYEIDRLTELQNAYTEFTNESIGLDELHRRMVNNYVYDQINMGSVNFVISTFQNLLNRNPTIAEQNAGVSMVDGNNSALFLQTGLSKDDFLNIITHSNNYYEAQVVLLYLKYLNRVPNTQEMSLGTLKYSTTTDYTLVQKDILSSNEFIGIQ